MPCRSTTNPRSIVTTTPRPRTVRICARCLVPPCRQRAGHRATTGRSLHAYGSRHELVVGPNSGYDTDNRCLLDFLERGNGRFKGVAVVDNHTGRSDLERLRDRGVVGTTMQASLLGVEHFRDTDALLRQLAALDMFADVQVDGDQLLEMAPILEPSGVRVLIDHCGRPSPAAGLDQPGFAVCSTWRPVGGTSSRYPDW